ncbi:MAG: phage recombination protein Bet [Egibacteraceae bacterium]
MTDITIFKMDRAKAIEVLGASLYPGASGASIEMVLGWCEARGVDPMDKPCHVVPMWDKDAGRMRDVIMPSVDYYRAKAESSGAYVGVSDTEYGPMQTLTVGEFTMEYPEWARVVVRRMVSGVIAEFPAKVFWVETYATAKKDTKVPNAMWKKRPIGQLEKCAEAQALRKAFPKLCSGPTAEEMHGKVIGDAEVEIISARVEGPRTIDQAAAASADRAPEVAPPADSASPEPTINAAPTGTAAAGAAPPPAASAGPVPSGAAPHTPLKPAQARILTASLARAGKTDEHLAAKFGFDVAGFPFEKFNEAQKWLQEGGK